MRTIYKFFLCLFSVLLSFLPVIAQQAGEVEMADTLRSNGKIYVVVAVLLIILFGLIIFLIRIDRKVSRLEKKQEKNI